MQLPGSIAYTSTAGLKVLLTLADSPHPGMSEQGPTVPERQDRTRLFLVGRAGSYLTVTVAVSDSVQQGLMWADRGQSSFSFGFGVFGMAS